MADLNLNWISTGSVMFAMLLNFCAFVYITIKVVQVTNVVQKLKVSYL